MRWPIRKRDLSFITSRIRDTQRRFYPKYRLQNSPYFWVFKYARAVKQKVWNETENSVRDWESGRVRLASFARVRLIRHALPILY